MKIGIKTYDDGDFLNHFSDVADFFEVMAIRGEDYSFLRKFSKPIVIHAEHHTFGTNYANKSKQKENLESINYAKKIADTVNSEKIIVHPGIIEYNNPISSLENAVSFVKDLNDERILVENLPKKENSLIESLCHLPEQIKEFMEKTCTKFCFDINHVVDTSYLNGSDYLELAKRFLELKPSHYHIGGHNFKNGESHISLIDSHLDLKEILSYFSKDAMITLETEVDEKKVEEDIKIIRSFIPQ